MKVCLVNPTTPKPMWGLSPNLGIAYIAAYLKRNDIDVKILDRYALLKRNKSFEVVNKKTRKFLMQYKPDFIGISATSPLINDSYLVARIAKEELPSSKVFLGGVHPSALPKKSLDGSEDIDLVVVGEGELTTLDLVGDKKLSEVQGIVYRENGNIKVNEKRKPISNLDILPFPARELLDMDLYLQPNSDVIRGIYLRATSIFTSRGCTHKCAYCSGGLVFSNCLRFHSPEYVIREIGHLVEKYKVEGLSFCDDQFLAYKKRIEEICRKMIETGLNTKVKWEANVRSDAINEPILRLMKKAGCVQLGYGFESGSQRILDLMNKKSKIETNFAAGRLTKKIGIRILANMIMGMPTETKEEIIASFRFLERLEPEFTGLFKLIPLPATQIWEYLEKKQKAPKDFKDYDFLITSFNFTKVDDKTFNRLFDEFLSNNEIPGNIKNEIVATMKYSPHKLKFLFKRFPRLFAGYVICKLGLRERIQKIIS